MTELGGNSRVPSSLKQGVILGGRQRTITLSRDDDQRLTILARLNNASPTTMLEFIVSQGLELGWQQVMIAKLCYVLSHWYMYARP